MLSVIAVYGLWTDSLAAWLQPLNFAQNHGYQSKTILFIYSRQHIYNAASHISTYFDQKKHKKHVNSTATADEHRLAIAS